MIFSLIKKSLSKKSSSKLTHRSDVVTKTIFRILRQFFNDKFYGYLAKPELLPRLNVFGIIDSMT